MNSTAKKIKDLLERTGKTVCTAESITAGHLQSELASVSGSSKTFKGGITAYMPDIKIEQLGIDESLAERTNCVSEAIASELVKGALNMFQSDYALATCGYAEPFETDQGIAFKPHAFFAIGVRNNDGTVRILFKDRIELLGFNRIEAQRETARVVLEKFEALLSKT